MRSGPEHGPRASVHGHDPWDHDRTHPNGPPTATLSRWRLRCYLGHGASGTAASMAPFVNGLRARGVDAPRPSTCPSARPRTRCRPSTWSCRRAADVAVGGHSYGGRVASLAAAEPDAPVRRARPVQLPAPSARRARADRGADRPLAGDPLPGPAPVGRVRPVRQDRPAARRGAAARSTPSWSPIRGSGTPSSRSSTTSSTARRRSCWDLGRLTRRGSVRPSTNSPLSRSTWARILTVPQAPRDTCRRPERTPRRRTERPRPQAPQRVVQRPAATQPTLGALTASSR